MAPACKAEVLGLTLAGSACTANSDERATASGFGISRRVLRDNAEPAHAGAECQPSCAIAQPGAFEHGSGGGRYALRTLIPAGPDQSAVSSVVGNAATNAGGSAATSTGVTSDYVLGMQVSIAEGRAF